VLTSLSLLLHRQLITQVREHHGAARLHVVPSLCPMSVSPADFTRAPDLLRRSRVLTDDWLDRGLDLSTGATALDLHEHTAHGSTTRRSA
jgi:NTE family protein